MKIAILAAAALLAVGTLATPIASYADEASATLKSVDHDADGTIDLNEAKKAAMENFATLDKDHDGTLDQKEAGMDVSKTDSDKDGTLDKAEFEATVTKTFGEADTDHDGTVDARELSTPDGQKLAAMMK